MAWDICDLQNTGRPFVSLLQAIRYLYAEFDVNQPDTLVEAQSITKVGISSNPRADAQTGQLTKMKNNSTDHKQKYETEAAWATYIYSEHILMQRNSINTLTPASGAIVLLSKSLNKKLNKFRDMLRERGEHEKLLVSDRESAQ